MKYTIFLIILAFLVPSPVFASPGNTDATSGHYCRTNCEQYGLTTNEYHYHDSNGAIVATYLNNGGIYDKTLANRLKGQILLQVAEHGEAWYIRSSDSMRYYMKDGETAYQMMRHFSLGITNKDLATVPSVANTVEMNSSTSVCASNATARRLAGEILLQVEEHGEAWYVDPVKCRSIYMADGAAAYEIMRFLGLGIINADLEKIVIGTTDFAVSNPTPTANEESQVTASNSFNGSGSDITSIFDLNEGLVLFTTTHSGESNFITKLLNSDGETVEYVTNEIGNYDGISVGRIDAAGQYLLNIDADGVWTIDVTQPHPTSGESVPFTATGISNNVAGPIYLSSGLHTFEMSHQGTSNFIVKLIDIDGNVVEYLANEIGGADISQAAGIDVSGIYYLSVTGDIGWSVTVK